jgi:hypothetical protein
MTIVDDTERVLGRVHLKPAFERVENEEGAVIVEATRVAEKPLDPALVKRLGLASDRLGTDCHCIQSPRGEVAGEPRRHSDLVGGALLQLVPVEGIDPKFVVLLAIAIEMMSLRIVGNERFGH